MRTMTTKIMMMTRTTKTKIIEDDEYDEDYDERKTAVKAESSAF